MGGTIKNIVFDIGNVIVRWDPIRISTRTFGAERSTPEFVGSIFGPETWLPLNRGELTATQAKEAYQDRLGLSAAEADKLFYNINDSLDLLTDTIALMERLQRAGFRIFALSDNVHEIVHYLKQRYDFWRFFEGAVISAEIGLLKPSPAIFLHLLETHALRAEECVFLDDVLANVEGARAVGMQALQFSHARRAEQELKSLGLVFEG
jgi:putative hydrolase of the HAD superfamily